MKKMTAAALSLIGLTSGVAHADYQCQDVKGEVKLVVQENQTNPIGNTVISLESTLEKKVFFANLSSEEDDPFITFKEKVFALAPFQGDTLTVTHTPNFCGRGACHPDSVTIKARLKLGETLTFFTCHETNH